MNRSYYQQPSSLHDLASRAFTSQVSKKMNNYDFYFGVALTPKDVRTLHIAAGKLKEHYYKYTQSGVFAKKSDLFVKHIYLERSFHRSWCPLSTHRNELVGGIIRELLSRMDGGVQYKCLNVYTSPGDHHANVIIAGGEKSYYSPMYWIYDDDD